MKKEHSFGVLDVIVLSMVAIFSVGFTAELLTKTAIRDRVSVQIVHDTDYYANALIADHDVVPGLPSAEEIIDAEGEKLARLYLKAAGAYDDFATQAKDKSNVSSLYEKYAYYNYLAGTVYQDSLHDNETACWYYGGALSADQSNPLYRASYDSPVCQSYRSK